MKRLLALALLAWLLGIHAPQVAHAQVQPACPAGQMPVGGICTSSPSVNEYIAGSVPGFSGDGSALTGIPASSIVSNPALNTYFSLVQSNTATDAYPSNSTPILSTCTANTVLAGLPCYGPANGTKIVSPTWVRIGSFTFTNLTAAALSNSITLFTLPAGAIVHGMKVVPTTSFTGGALTSYTLQIGITGTLGLFAPAYNVFTSTGATVFQLTPQLQEVNESSTTTVLLTATSTGANLSAATAGAATIWVLISEGT